MSYSIAEVAKKYNLAPHTLRYYDKEGLLPFMERTDSGVRVFSDRDLSLLDVILCLKDSGLTIKQIKKYVQWCIEGDSSLKKRLDFMLEHKKEMQKQIEQLNKHMELIDYKIWYYETSTAAGSTDVHEKKSGEVAV